MNIATAKIRLHSNLPNLVFASEIFEQAREVRGTGEGAAIAELSFQHGCRAGEAIPCKVSGGYPAFGGAASMQSFHHAAGYRIFHDTAGEGSCSSHRMRELFSC